MFISTKVFRYFNAAEFSITLSPWWVWVLSLIPATSHSMLNTEKVTIHCSLSYMSWHSSVFLYSPHHWSLSRKFKASSSVFVFCLSPIQKQDHCLQYTYKNKHCEITQGRSNLSLWWVAMPDQTSSYKMQQQKKKGSIYHCRTPARCLGDVLDRCLGALCQADGFFVRTTSGTVRRVTLP